MSNEIRRQVYTDALCQIQESLSYLFNYWLTDERRQTIKSCIEMIEEMKDEKFQYTKEDAE